MSHADRARKFWRNHEESVINKVSDGDFQNVMKSIGFSMTPRETITVGQMIKFHEQAVEEGREDIVYGKLSFVTTSSINVDTHVLKELTSIQKAFGR